MRLQQFINEKNIKWKESFRNKKYITAYRAENAGRGIMTDSIQGGVYFFPQKKHSRIMGRKKWKGNKKKN